MTIYYEHDVIIERPVEEVYAYISDVSNASEWMPWADKTAVITGLEPSGIAKGQRRLIRQTDFGIQTETVLEATDVDPGRNYTFESVEGPIDFRGEYRFEPAEEGTQLIRTYHIELPRLTQIIEPVMARRMKRRWVSDLERIKNILEDERGESDL